MFNRFLSFCIVYLLTVLSSQAQFYNAPLSGTANTAINIPNISGITPFSNNYFYANAVNYSIYNNPVVNLTPNTFANNLLQTPAFSDLAFDGTNYYLFTTNYGGGVIRWDYGTNILSTPTAYSIPGIGPLQQVEGITIRKDGVNWYGFVCSNNAGQRLTRLDFGTNLANPAPTLTNLGVLTLSWPHEMKIFDDGGNWYGFVANRNTKVTRLDFGNSLTNVPTTFVYNSPDILSPCNLRVVNDAGNWYLFSVNLFNGDIVRSDLGPNLANNTPVYNNMGEPHPTLGIARGFTIIQDCNGIRGILCDEGSNMFDLSFAGNSITGAITGTPTSTIPLTGTINDFTPFWNNDILYFIVTNPYTNYVGLTQINPTLSPGNQSSTAFSPTFNYSTAGNYNMSFLINTGSSGMRFQCAPINITSVATVNYIKCPGDTIMLSNNSIISVPGAYNDTLKDINNMDSIINVVFSNYPVYSDTDTVSICQGLAYTLPSNTVVTMAGNYIDTLNSVNGCDSIITTILNVNPIYNISVNDTICMNDTYTLPGGSTVTTAGTYVDAFLTAQNCDSIITTELVVNPSYQLNVNAIICQGDNYTLPDNTVVSSPGTYVSNLQTLTNCDSIVTTILSLLPTSQSSETINLCDQNSYELPSGSSVNSSGTYTSTFTAANGCDSIITSTVNFNTTVTGNINITICQGSNFTLPDNIVVSTAGTYTSNLLTINGCDSIITTIVTVVEPPIVELGNDTTLCNNGTITIDVTSSNASYLWNDQSVSPVRQISEVGYYSVQVAIPPCPPVNDDIKISGCDCEVFIPNAFSPNRDTKNDKFKPIINCNIISNSYKFEVYNRWGEVVFFTTIPNDAWDGTYKTVLQNIGTYFYQVKFKNSITEKDELFKGDVILVK